MPKPLHSAARLVGLTIILTGLMGGGAGCRSLEPTDPDPIAVASSSERTETAILDALRREGWAIETASPGEIYVRDEVSDFPLRARVAFDDAEVVVTWIDVDGLDELPIDEADARKAVRRRLRALMERIEYRIESADLTAE